MQIKREEEDLGEKTFVLPGLVGENLDPLFVQPHVSLSPEPGNNEPRQRRAFSYTLKHEPGYRRRERTTFTALQLDVLERLYKKCKYLDEAATEEVAGITNLSKFQVVIWFKNRRAKDRKPDEDNSSPKPSAPNGLKCSKALWEFPKWKPLNGFHQWKPPSGFPSWKPNLQIKL